MVTNVSGLNWDITLSIYVLLRLIDTIKDSFALILPNTEHRCMLNDTIRSVYIMKRILFISLSNLLLLTACGTSASKNIPSDTQISNSIDSTISTNEKNSPVETSDIKVSTSAKNRVKKLSARLLYFKQTLN